MFNRCIIVGGGASIRNNQWNLSGYDIPLWKIIKNECLFTLNWSYLFVKPTISFYSDYQFYYTNKEDLDKILMVISLDDGYYHREQVTKPEKNIFLLKPNSHYYGNKSWKEGWYSKQLVGIFALNFAIQCGFKEIYLCYDKETEVFTNNGWKYFKNLDGNEQILTRKANGQTEWSKIIKQQQYLYNGYMKYIKSRGIDLLVTPDHQFYLEPTITLKRYNNPKNKHHPIEKDGYIHRKVNEFTSANYKIPKIFQWNGKKLQYFILPALKEKLICQWNYDKPKKIKIESFLKFIGLYLSEGCLSNYKTKREYKIIIYQNHTIEKDNYILSILKKLPFKYYKTKRGWIIINKQLYKYIENSSFGKNCYTKQIPLWIKNLNKKNLEFLLEALIFGDGCKGQKMIKYYFTTSKQLADDVQEIAYKCGFYAGIYYRKKRISFINNKKIKSTEQWTVELNYSKKQGNSRAISVRNLVFNKKIIDILYNDYIYDITVEKNHVIWVRRNNQCVWAGNCGYDAIAINNHTHFYDDIPNLGTYIWAGQKHSGVGIDNRGYYKTGNYNNPKALNEIWFKPFEQEHNVKIFNVSLESVINTFPKISYEDFFKNLNNNPLQTNSEEIRNSIKLLIKEKS